MFPSFYNPRYERDKKKITMYIGGRRGKNPPWQFWLGRFGNETFREEELIPSFSLAESTAAQRRGFSPSTVDRARRISGYPGALRVIGKWSFRGFVLYLAFGKRPKRKKEEKKTPSLWGPWVV
jgi:hypothetical protein